VKSRKTINNWRKDVVEAVNRLPFNVGVRFDEQGMTPFGPDTITIVFTVLRGEQKYQISHHAFVERLKEPPVSYIIEHMVAKLSVQAIARCG
jgi:hypothetical protein